jgi:hypothetical protein
MSEKELKEMKELDEAAEEAGGFLAPFTDFNIHYDYRKIIEYCGKKEIEPIDLTIRELQNFIIA